MKRIEDLLADLERRGIELWIEGDRLRYTSSKAALTTAQRDELRARQHEIRDVLAAGLPQRIVRARRDRALPLGPGQRAFWSLEQSVPGNSFSNVFTALHLEGPLDATAMQRTFDEIGRRHEALRTTFAVVDGQPAQLVAMGPIARLAHDDLTACPASERETTCARHILDEARRPFDLSNGPLLRIRLLALGAREHLLLLTVHHIICDAWSMQLLVREFATIYEAFVTDRPCALPEPPIQYGDFAAWHCDQLIANAFASDLAFWRKQLHDGDLPDVHLSLERPRGTSRSFRTSRESLHLPSVLVEQLRNVAYDAGCTLFMALLAVIDIAIHGITGENDVRVGTLVAVRDRPEVERVFGLFVNTLIVRTDLGGAPSAVALLERVRDSVLAAYDHQALPFEMLVPALERLQDRDALVRILFLFGDAPLPSYEAGELAIQPLDLGKGLLEAHPELATPTTFDVILTLSERTGGVAGTLVYKTELFSAQTIRRAVDYIVAIAERVASSPHDSIASLPSYSSTTRSW